MGCPAENTLLAWIDGRLGEAERSAIALHLDRCEECSALVGQLSPSAAARSPALTREPASIAAPEQLQPGDSLARYVIQRELGAGGMGVVYEALDPLLHRKLAVKVLRKNLLSPASEAELHARLLREAKALARLAHPNVVAVHDVGTAGGRLFIAMDYLPGGTLSQWLRDEPRSLVQVLDVYLRAGRGLAAAHEAGLVHRDFKPANVLVAGGDGSAADGLEPKAQASTPGRVCVTDFGLARLVGAGDVPAGAPLQSPGEASGEPELTRTGALLGSPAYMAPEQLAGAPADARSDVFSFCVALWAAVYGARPFAGATLAELRESIAQGRLRAPPAGSEVPAWLRAALARGLRQEPLDRFQSMGELLSELERERAGQHLSRAQRVLLEAERFFTPDEAARSVSRVAVTLLEGALGSARGPLPPPRLRRPDLALMSEVEVSGVHLQALLDAQAPYRLMMSHLLVRDGYGPPDEDGALRFAADAWYPVLPLVHSSARSVEEFGELSAQRTGRALVAQALRRFPMPPDLPLKHVIEFLDRALLGHYRLRGKRLDQHEPPLCDAMGRQRLTDLDAAGLTIVASDPFTCSSAIGYFTELIHRFDAGATLTHLPGPCRREGHAECRYRVAYGRPKS